jgi:hypothetical protein
MALADSKEDATKAHRSFVWSSYPPNLLVGMGIFPTVLRGATERSAILPPCDQQTDFSTPELGGSYGRHSDLDPHPRAPNESE